MTIIYLGVWLACGVLAVHVYRQRGHTSAWGLGGCLVLGPIGLTLAWLTPPREAATPSASPTRNLLVFGAVMLAAALWCVLAPLLPHLF